MSGQEAWGYPLAGLPQESRRGVRPVVLAAAAGLVAGLVLRWSRSKAQR